MNFFSGKRLFWDRCIPSISSVIPISCHLVCLWVMLTWLITKFIKWKIFVHLERAGILAFFLFSSGSFTISGADGSFLIPQSASPVTSFTFPTVPHSNTMSVFNNSYLLFNISQLAFLALPLLMLLAGVHPLKVLMCLL